MAGMILVFSVLYVISTNRRGFLYRNEIMAASQENDVTVYSARIDVKTARFTVEPDGTVVFTYGDKTYGPYVVKEDPSAIPVNSDLRSMMTGVEITCAGEVMFRGGFVPIEKTFWIYNEDGTNDVSITYTSDQGYETDGYGHIIDPIEPMASDLIRLRYGSLDTHKGTWWAFTGAVFICLITAISILYADELFRWQLSFRISDPHNADPSDWEITSRYLAWTIFPLMALYLFMTGLQAVV